MIAVGTDFRGTTKRKNRTMPTSQSHVEPPTLAKRLARYGCTDFIRLDETISAPEQLDYLDLLPKQSNQSPRLSAVAVHQGTALLYVVDACGDLDSDPDTLAELRRQLANRSDPAWLGVVDAGSLEIFPIGFHETAGTQPVKIVSKSSKAAPLFFQSLVHGTFEQNNKLNGIDYVYRKIFELLTRTIERFVPQDGKGAIDSLEILSMAGRALFFRFLIDRRIVRPSELQGSGGICPAATELKDAFSTAEKSAMTSAWLDATFNGDFLPLIDESIPHDNRSARQAAYRKFYDLVEQLVGKSIFTHLQAILRGWEAVGDTIQTEIDWGDLDFAHIPVGVLSQVYESFSHRADSRTAKDTSVHYTPRTIAQLMVNESFAALKHPADAKVLDSACGAGIFLVLSFRRLVQERWQRDGRPKTAEIQKILYDQIRGFDISEPALRLAALALYITSIELNASPRPPKSLRFPRNLRGEVLHRFDDSDEVETPAEVFPLGSLGPDVPSEYEKWFDVVIGNPPWTRLRDRIDDDDDIAGKLSRKAEINAANSEFTAIGRRVLETAGQNTLAKQYDNPDMNPDLPFLWRAIEWAKPDGVIVLAMPARVFSRTSGKGRFVWRAILSCVEITGLINGADLRKTAVWEGIDMPFCVLFARNRLPRTDYSFRFATPLYDPNLNSEGRFRIDYEAAQTVHTEHVKRQPWLLKTLSLGTWLDVEVMESLCGSRNKTLIERWREWDSAEESTGQGYNRSPRLKQTFVDFLAELPDFIKPPAACFQIDYNTLVPYGELYGTNSDGQSSALFPRREELYQPPLVVIPQAPGDSLTSPKAFLCSRAVAFSQSYYGYSCAGHPHAETLAALIYLLAHSTLFRYFALMISVSQGADHMIFRKRDFDALPFPVLEELTSSQKSLIRRFAKAIQNKAVKPWREMNEFVFELYGLDADAAQVAEDTLFASAPYRIAGRGAFQITDRKCRTEFLEEIRESLEPYFDVCGEQVAVREAEFQPDDWSEPWFFLSISRKDQTVLVNPKLMQKAMTAANQNGCSRIIAHAPKKGGILLGVLNQRRWWTTTRARLCAQHIIRGRLGACGLPEDE